MNVKSDHRSKFSNLNNWKEEAWKNQGFNGIRTRDLRDTGAMLYCTGRYELNKLTSLPTSGFIAQLVEPWFFQASSFQLLKLENLLRWSLFTFIYNRSTNMNYFIYIKKKTSQTKPS